jgi:hypothetical protein
MTEEMIKGLSDNYSLHLANARAFTMNGEIFINEDLASTADVLHELAHLLLPGLKARNQEAY